MLRRDLAGPRRKKRARGQALVPQQHGGVRRDLGQRQRRVSVRGWGFKTWALLRHNTGVAIGSAGWPLKPQHAYYRLSGEHIVTATATGTLPSSSATWGESISDDDVRVWTGFSTSFGEQGSCEGWSSSSISGRFGDPRQRSGQAWSLGSGSCTTSRYLYCVEQ